MSGIAGVLQTVTKEQEVGPCSQKDTIYDSAAENRLIKYTEKHRKTMRH